MLGPELGREGAGGVLEVFGRSLSQGLEQARPARPRVHTHTDTHKTLTHSLTHARARTHSHTLSCRRAKPAITSSIRP